MHKKTCGVWWLYVFFNLGCGDGFTNIYICQYQTAHLKYGAFIGFQFYHNKAIIPKKQRYNETEALYSLPLSVSLIFGYLNKRSHGNEKTQTLYLCHAYLILV